MTIQAATPDPLRPPHDAGLRQSALLALAVHLLLIVLLSVGVHWHSAEPPAVDAELWSASPQYAGAAPPPPPPPVATPKPTPLTAPTGPRDADIALARQRALAKAKHAAALKLQQHEAAQKKLAQQHAELKAAELKAAELKAAKRAALKKQQQLARLQQQARDAYLKNMLAQAGSGPSHTGGSGNAAVTSGPSGGYGARIATLIKQNVIYPQLDQVDGNPKVTLRVTLDPNTGEVLGTTIVHSSGVASWDQAVQRALGRVGRLPSDHGRWWTPMQVTAGPRDAH